MSIAATKEEFEHAAAGLSFTTTIDLADEVVCIEPITGSYFLDDSKQRCIVRRRGTLYLANYD
jgi:hypothetical protein